MNKTEELREIKEMAETALRRLENLILSYDEADEGIMELDEAADALSDAVEILEEL